MCRLTCVICPIGCRIHITKREDSSNWIIEGHNCSRGVKYAEEEMVAPRRILTSVVKVEGTSLVLPVKGEKPIPKERLFEAMREIKGITAKPPLRIGEVLKTNLADTGVNLVVTKNCL